MIKISKSSKFTVLVMALLPIMLAGCETVAGAGQDISAAGHVVTGTAQQSEIK